MNEINILCEPENQGTVGRDICITASDGISTTKKLEFKFMISIDGIWETLSEFKSENKVVWTPKRHGNYLIMVQTREQGSKKPFDYVSRCEYEIIDKKNENQILITDFKMENEEPSTYEELHFTVNVDGSKENALYKFLKIDEMGNVTCVQEYSSMNSTKFKEKISGQYKLLCFVKDANSAEYCGDKAVLHYYVRAKEKNIESSVKTFKGNAVIQGITVHNKERIVKNEVVTISVLAKGSDDIRYSFVVTKGGKVVEKRNFNVYSWIEFKPSESGIYNIEILVKDKFSEKEWDDSYQLILKVADYIKGKIDYVLLPKKENYVVGEDIKINIIAQDTKNVLVRYSLEANGHIINETDYETNMEYIFNPKYSGKYMLHIFLKNKMSRFQYDDVKHVNMDIVEAPPITNTRIEIVENSMKVNKCIIFDGKCDGGRNVLFEYYLMEGNSWKKVQSYDRKSRYGFMPFRKGKFKLMLLTKSEYKNAPFEDYNIQEFTVNE